MEKEIKKILDEGRAHEVERKKRQQRHADYVGDSGLSPQRQNYCKECEQGTPDVCIGCLHTGPTEKSLLLLQMVEELDDRLRKLELQCAEDFEAAVTARTISRENARDKEQQREFVAKFMNLILGQAKVEK